MNPEPLKPSPSLKESLQALVKRLEPYVQIGLFKTGRFVRASRWLTGAAFSLVALIIIAAVIKWASLGPVLRLLRLLSLIPALFFYFNASACRALVARILLFERLSFQDCFLNVCQGSLCNRLFPMHPGDNARAYFVAHRLEDSFFHIRSLIRVERLYDAFIAAGLLNAALVMLVQPLWLQSALVGSLALLVVLLLSVPLAAQGTTQLRLLAGRLFESFPWLGGRLQTRVYSLIEGLTVLSSWRVFGASLFWALLSWGFRVTGLFIIVKNFAPYATFGYAVAAAGVLALGMRLPSGPAALGIYEGAIMLALFSLGVDPTTGLAIALVSHLVEVLLPLAPGGLALYRDGEPLTGFYEKLAALN
jgi:glycosyltransferase 2 family protein